VTWSKPLSGKTLGTYPFVFPNPTIRLIDDGGRQRERIMGALSAAAAASDIA
jgi:hypothetical protein